MSSVNPQALWILLFQKALDTTNHSHFCSVLLSWMPGKLFVLLDSEGTTCRVGLSNPPNSPLRTLPLLHRNLHPPPSTALYLKLFLRCLFVLWVCKPLSAPHHNHLTTPATSTVLPYTGDPGPRFPTCATSWIFFFMSNKRQVMHKGQ